MIDAIRIRSLPHLQHQLLNLDRSFRHHFPEKESGMLIAKIDFLKKIFQFEVFNSYEKSIRKLFYKCLEDI